MDAELLRRVSVMVAEFAGYPLERLSADSVLEADVGITGDDAGEFMEGYSREFQIDLSGFEFHRHFDAGGWNPFVGFFTKLRGGEEMQHVPVTIALLVRAAEEHRWPAFTAPAT
jgi:Protein of unknown function (DUF1493)